MTRFQAGAELDRLARAEQRLKRLDYRQAFEAVRSDPQHAALVRAYSRAW